MNPNKCQAIVWSDALRKKRQCRNFAGHSGYCPRHPNGEVPKNQPRVKVRKPTVPPATRELEAARTALEAARAFLHDPTKKGRFVEALSTYDDVRSSNPVPAAVG